MGTDLALHIDNLQLIDTHEHLRKERDWVEEGPDILQDLFGNYVPADLIVESKSLKLFLGSFRNQAAFHEDCTIDIAKRLIDAMAPTWLRIGGYWYPRGGIPIDVFYQTGKAPAGVWIPDQGVAEYRGRG